MIWLRQIFHPGWGRLDSVQLAAIIAALSFVVTQNQWLAFSFFTTMPAGWLRYLYGILVGILVFGVPTFTRLREQHKQCALRGTLPPVKTTGGTWGWLIAAAVAIAAPITAEMEGYVPVARPDPAGIETVCYGERLDLTNLQAGVIYSRATCLDRLRHRLTAQYAPVVLKCVPGFRDPARRNPFAAAIDLSWNVGPRAFCQSTIAQKFNAGLWRDGCNRFPDRWITADGRTLPGLIHRRQIERNLCLKDMK